MRRSEECFNLVARRLLSDGKGRYVFGNGFKLLPSLSKTWKVDYPRGGRKNTQEDDTSGIWAEACL